MQATWSYPRALERSSIQFPILYQFLFQYGCPSGWHGKNEVVEVVKLFVDQDFGGHL